MKSTKCISCGSDTLKTGLEFGLQPVTSHFYLTDDQQPVEYPLALGQCRACAMVQLVPPFPFGSVVPPHEWISYKEPEGHLDHMVSVIVERMGPDKDAQILGLSYKEDTTLERLNRLGFANTLTLDLHNDLGSDQPNANIESVAGLLSVETAKNIVKNIGKSEVIVARHVLEHAENPSEFMGALEELLAPNGVLVFEVPDCEANMRRSDISMIWEEHATYFTPDSFHSFFNNFGFEVEFFNAYPLSFEDCLVLMASKGKKGRLLSSQNSLKQELSLFDDYCRDVQINRTKIRDYFENATMKGDRFAIFGAGHLACTFINLTGIAKYITCIVDDSEEKQGLKMPGSGLEIISSNALLEQKITKCLLALSIEIEDKIIEKNSDFRQSGGEFYSILNASTRSYQKLL